MNDSPRFDPAHSDAIRAVLLDGVQKTTRRRPARRVAFIVAIATACALLAGGTGYAFASLHASPGTGGSDAVQPTATTAPLHAVPGSSSSPRPDSGNVEPASTPTPTPLQAPVTAATITTPTITTPTPGQVFHQTNTSILFSGTGTPGTNIRLTIECIIPGRSDACGSAQTEGQPWQTPIVVSSGGHWEFLDSYPGGPDKAERFAVTASAALVDANGDTLRDSTGALIQSGQSTATTFTQGPAAG